MYSLHDSKRPSSLDNHAIPYRVNNSAFRITSFNISRGNPLGRRALRILAKRKSDILCLQEVAEKRLGNIEKLGYALGKVADYQHEKGKTGYLVTGIKKTVSLISVEKARYYDDRIQVPWGFIYNKVAKLRERHEGLVTTVRYKDKIIRIVNLHLSTACRPKVRISQLLKMLEKYADERTIFCGDFNIVTDMLFKLVTGWACGYKFTDYLYDERAEVNKIIKQFKLQNPFAKRKTTLFPFHQQLDHILVPEAMKIVSKRMYKIALSDHKALQVDIAI